MPDYCLVPIAFVATWGIIILLLVGIQVIRYRRDAEYDEYLAAVQRANEPINKSNEPVNKSKKKKVSLPEFEIDLQQVWRKN